MLEAYPRERTCSESKHSASKQLKAMLWYGPESLEWQFHVWEWWTRCRKVCLKHVVEELEWQAETLSFLDSLDLVTFEFLANKKILCPGFSVFQEFSWNKPWYSAVLSSLWTTDTNWISSSWYTGYSSLFLVLIFKGKSLSFLLIQDTQHDHFQKFGHF